MTVTTVPAVLQSHLHKADGSATFSHAGYTVVGAVNGPIEAQKRDELPEEAIIDVVIRPAAGVGGPRERHLESLIQSTLRQIVLINNFPRSLIQVILQITMAPENDYVNSKLAQANVNLPVLPALLQTAVLATLSAALPLTATIASVPLAIALVDGRCEVLNNPTAREIEQSRSFHVFAFTSDNQLILSESEGSFTMSEWENAYAIAQDQCCLSPQADGDAAMDQDRTAAVDLKAFTRSALEQKTASDLYWK
ncbi:hypothetical protein GGR57DRAFT_214580 [Xylariaceae sp. FL1272]|nr:hypothetical protein GGR57DRAFT_214580 [Xylariaceae sp. FL1272]